MRRSGLFRTLFLLLCWLVPAHAADKVTPPEGFEPLFNGKDLTGWEVIGGKFEGWGNDKELIFTARADGGWLRTEKEYSNFELMFECRVSKGSKSAVILRAAGDGKPPSSGITVPLLDDASHKDLPKSERTGSLLGVVESSKDVSKPVGEWNRFHITIKGRTAIVKLNDVEIVNTNLDDHKAKFKTHPGLASEKGHLCLQGHETRVEFRNLYLKILN